ncbi:MULTISPECIES: cytochrome bd oxidase small subunit CydS [Gracilibacillus]
MFNDFLIFIAPFIVLFAAIGLAFVVVRKG